MANAGHIGTSLSCLEILVDLCFGRMEGEDVLVLSKGHAAAALYTALSLSDRLPETELSTFYKDGTVLSAHPPCSGAIRAIPFGTGSLGHGFGSRLRDCVFVPVYREIIQGFCSVVRRRLQ